MNAKMADYVSASAIEIAQSDVPVCVDDHRADIVKFHQANAKARLVSVAHAFGAA